MRMLASVQTISALRPIEGADRIEVADVLGWHVVVKKGDYVAGTPCVYVEIDSILPEKPEFEFMRERHFRVKTVRLRGQVSQGICFPLSILPPEGSYVEGTDISEALGIQKYEPPEFETGLGAFGLGKSRQKAPFPSWISKTDETRVQSVPWIIEHLKGVRCYISAKKDGSSITLFLKDGKFGVCSRTMEKTELDTCHFWKGAKNVDAENKMRAWSTAHNNRDIALQGELVGPGIQKNRDQHTDYSIFFFNAFDPATDSFLAYEDFVGTIKEMGLETVPILNDNFVMDESTTVDGLVQMATKRSIVNPKSWQEGIVIRPVVEMYHRKLGRVSFKCINPQYLLETEK